jgi:glycosyltransferase involved in cell wall biosynthesis
MVDRWASARHDPVRSACRPARSELARLDLVHVLDAREAPGAEWIAASPAPVVLDFHDDYADGAVAWPSPDRFLRKWIWARRAPRLRRAAAAARGRIVHSRHMARRIEGATLVPIAVPPHAAGPAGAGAPGRERPPFSTKPVEILFAGRDSARKGLPVLLRAMRRLGERGLDARLVVLGRDYTHLEAANVFLAGALPVRFAGELAPRDLARAMARADLVALPAWTEAFGLVLVEAMALGTPVLGTSVGGVPEIIEDGRTGTLVRPGDPEALARAIERLAADPARTRGMASRGREDVRARFTERAMAEALEAAYRAAVGGSRP